MIYPMFVISLLTIFVGLIAVKVRMAGVKNGTIRTSYFKLMQGQEVPDIVVKTTRSFNNLFEVPVLFYVVCTLYIVVNVESSVAIIFSWAFVVLRCVQAYIHITYNNVRHRMFAFGLSVLCVFFLWCNLMILSI